ncbi:MAG TPA: TIGR04283 family arsenosugar biosynthesis glycosyltransferase [Burkholderiales bacterium]|nr:TIGR04283 family arsenosugar biosynthesis glycosyltransferase [Burkholderiales bacterium]
MTRLSIIIPCLNEEAVIVRTLQALQPLRARGADVIVVDGGSSDATCELARTHADTMLQAPRGRSIQMNAGAARAGGDVLLFLHADSILPPMAGSAIVDGLAACGRHWGRFDVRIAGRDFLLPLIARSMNLRSRVTGVATGDQGIFVTRDAFDAVGGFPPLALMEDIAISKRLRQAYGMPLALRDTIVTSGRRWDSNGVLRTLLLMWRLRLAYFAGADSDKLAAHYGPERH